MDANRNSIFNETIEKNTKIYVSKGTYTFTFSADGFDNETIVKSIYEDTTLNVNLEVASVPGFQFALLSLAIVSMILFLKRKRKQLD